MNSPTLATTGVTVATGRAVISRLNSAGDFLLAGMDTRPGKITTLRALKASVPLAYAEDIPHAIEALIRSGEITRITKEKYTLP